MADYVSKEWFSHAVQQDIDGIVYHGPVYLRSVSLSSSSGTGSVLVYDGLNANGKLKLRLYVPDAGTVERSYRKSIKFDTGIYAVFDDATSYANFEIWPGRKGPQPE